MPTHDATRLALADAFKSIANLYPIALGGCVLGGGPLRMELSPAFTVVLDWMPAHAWGAAFILGGLFSLAADRPHVRLVGWMGLAAMFWIWEAAIALAAFGSEEAVWTGVPTYGAVATGYTALAVFAWKDIRL